MLLAESHSLVVEYAVVEQVLCSLYVSIYIVGGYVYASFTTGFFEARACACYYRSADGERLYHGQAETFVARGIRRNSRIGIQCRKVAERHIGV